MDHPWMYTMDVFGETPTTRARKSGYTVLAEMLLSQEHALSAKEAHPVSQAVDEHAYWGMSHSVHKLILDAPRSTSTDGDIDRLLQKATQNGDVDQVKELLQAGANADHESEQGLTPLHWSALNGRADLVEVLIEHGADINQRERYTGKLTPMAMALLMGYDDVVELMAGRGGVC
jgi:ankyrin repeat protein